MKACEAELRERGLYDEAFECARKVGATLAEMFSASRAQHAVRARQMFMKHLVEERGWSSTAVGKLLGRDHTTVLAAVRKSRVRSAA